MVAFSTGPGLESAGSTPPASPASLPLGWPKPKRRCRCRQRCSLGNVAAILAAPTLLDMVITPVTSVQPVVARVADRRYPATPGAGLVSIGVLGFVPAALQRRGDGEGLSSSSPAHHVGQSRLRRLATSGAGKRIEGL